MPLIINDGRVPDHWTAHKNSRPLAPAAGICGNGNGFRAATLRIALLNNMPDAALEDTEFQFFSLLEAAATDIPVQVELYSLPDVPRGDRVQDHLANYYRPVGELWNQHFDGAIITGTEPRQRNLRDEPYWQTLANVFDWAEEHTASTVLSCLAAHASVLHSDSIERNPLPDKQFGVFDYQRIGGHQLTDGLPPTVRFPHSRWNEVRAEALTAHGYTVLDKSDGAGVNLFVKNKGTSLFVHFQGHPEYGSLTLLKEYRRDVRRFLRQERPTYPTMPHGYFDPLSAKVLEDFRENAQAHAREDALSTFPDSQVTDALQNTWHSFATRIYRNWLQFISAKMPSASPGRTLTPAVRA
jgi:homoserine O-succinyltransferase